MFRQFIPVAAVVLALSGGSALAAAEQGKSGQQKTKQSATVEKDKQKEKDKKKGNRGNPNDGSGWSQEQRARYAAVLPAGMTLEQAAAGFPNHGQAVAALNAASEHNVSFVRLKQLMVNERLSLGEALRRLGR